jgi:hypothetical protein
MSKPQIDELDKWRFLPDEVCALVLVQYPKIPFLVVSRWATAEQRRLIRLLATARSAPSVIFWDDLER